MNIDLPPEIENAERRFFSNDGTPVIVDFSIDDDPIAAYRLGTDRGGLAWLPLEEDLFVETYETGFELDFEEEFYEKVIAPFVESRKPTTGADLG